LIQEAKVGLEPKRRMMTTKCSWVSFFGSLCSILRVAMGCPPLMDEDLVDALDTEVTKITKKLAETRKVALAQLTRGSQQETRDSAGSGRYRV
jgi:hypothetical protein